MRPTCEVAIVGSGFAGSLLARVLAVLGYEVVLLERGAHPRFAIGESTTPLANLSLGPQGRRLGPPAPSARGPQASFPLLSASPEGAVRRSRPRFGAAARRREP